MLGWTNACRRQLWFKSGLEHGTDKQLRILGVVRSTACLFVTELFVIALQVSQGLYERFGRRTLGDQQAQLRLWVRGVNLVVRVEDRRGRG